MNAGPVIHRVESEFAVREAALALSAGGVVIYPTDTIYGLGADALSDSAVARIYEIKGRDEGKPVHAIVADLQMAERYAFLDERARRLAEKFLPGPLTLILKKKPGIETGIAKGIETFGIRIPNHPFCRALVEAFGGPITTTSANASGMMPEANVRAIIGQLGDAALKVDCAIDAGAVLQRVPSTVVDCSREAVQILREGAIPASEIEVILR